MIQSKSIIVRLLLAALAGVSVFWQSAVAQQPSSIAGIWKGTSLCQQKNSPCHDEEVVYHISAGKSRDEYTIVMKKIVNGQEEDMGTLVFTWKAELQELVSEPRPGMTWRFRLVGEKMEGTLYNNEVLYRIINAKKSR